MTNPKSSIALVVCNAPLPPQALLHDILRLQPLIICADGGADRLRRRGMEPDYIVGDLDSLSKQTQCALAAAKIIKVSDQESTDLEKALDFALSHGISRATVTGATGRRLDHTFANFSILLKYHQKMTLTFLDVHCTVQMITGDNRLNIPKGTIVSLMPMGRCEGIVTEGLAYPLQDEPLELGVREGLSNVVVSSPVHIHVGKGFLSLFIVHKK